MNDNFIIIAFPRYAGGKFISNCLSLSRHAIPQDLVAAEHLLTNSMDYQYRFSKVMETLLPRNDMHNWISKYEFGDRQLYGTAVESWQIGNYKPHTELIGKLMASGFRLFLTAHGGDMAVRNLLKVWPNSTIVTLINHVKFSKISRGLKSNDNKTLEDHAGNYCEKKYSELAGTSWPSWQQFESVGYDIRQLSDYDSVADEILEYYNWRGINNRTILFDIDNLIFNQTKFLTAMENLYKQLGLTDYDPTLVGKFWQSYMALHVNTVDLV